MHPILAERGRLGLYLAGWSPLAALVVVLLVVRGEASWLEGLALGLPLALVYAYLCLAAWYLCRLVPLRPPRPARLIAAHLVAAVLSSGVWALFGWAWVALLGALPAFSGAGGRYLGQTPLLVAMGVPIYLVSAAVHYVIQALESSRAAESRAFEARILAREAELKALKAQLDPHFLFNSLNTIAAQAGSDPAGARKMAILLAEFLRRSLRLGERAAIPLGEELAHAASYLAVERVRFGERLAVEEAVEEASRRCLVPPLILQPLVENAIRHGIAQLLEGGVIRIEARRQGGRLALAVENPADPDYPPAPGEGVGLANVRARLAARFRQEARLTVAPAPGRFRVEMAMPAVDPDERPAAEAIDGR